MGRRKDVDNQMKDNISTKSLLNSLREKYFDTVNEPHNWRDESMADYVDQEANDYIRKAIQNNPPGMMICKFGTIELDALCCCLRNKRGLTFDDCCDYIHGKCSIFPEDIVELLSNNAGFFPADVKLQYKFADLMESDLKYIDILASYIDEERYLSDELRHCIKVNLDGLYAPFKWTQPWTKELAGKNILVIHPFAESIKNQYKRRYKLFDNPEVLPEFGSLTVIKAVQSIAGNGPSTGFKDWFEALEYMEDKMDAASYDIALIGCGAYGMPLAAHAKRRGKIGIHLGAWVQMLFGIYGNRWIHDQPEYAKFINEYWIRPSKAETPKNFERVENGCYW